MTSRWIEPDLDDRSRKSPGRWGSRRVLGMRPAFAGVATSLLAALLAFGSLQQQPPTTTPRPLPPPFAPRAVPPVRAPMVLVPIEARSVDPRMVHQARPGIDEAMIRPGRPELDPRILVPAVPYGPMLRAPAGTIPRR